MNNAERLKKATAVLIKTRRKYDAACKIFDKAIIAVGDATQPLTPAEKASWHAAQEAYGVARDKLEKDQAVYDVFMDKIKMEKMQSAKPDAKKSAPKRASTKNTCKNRVRPKGRVSSKKK